MVLLPQTGIKIGLKFPVQNCIADQRDKYTHVRTGRKYTCSGENLFPPREITGRFKPMKKEDRKHGSI